MFRFLHELLYEALSFEHTTFDLTNLSDGDNRLRESSTEQSSVLEEQFETLNKLYKIISGDTSEALCGDNKCKQQTHNKILYDFWVNILLNKFFNLHANTSLGYINLVLLLSIIKHHSA